MNSNTMITHKGARVIMNNPILVRSIKSGMLASLLRMDGEKCASGKVKTITKTYTTQVVEIATNDGKSVMFRQRVAGEWLEVVMNRETGRLKLVANGRTLVVEESETNRQANLQTWMSPILRTSTEH